MSEKIKKFAIVIFLTVLLWAWAYNALEKGETFSATLEIAKNPNSELFVTFDPPAPVELKLELKGTTTKIDALTDLTDSGKEKLDFYFNAETEKKDLLEYPLDVIKFLEQSSKNREFGLSVVSCDVEFINVKVEKLIKQKLSIQCVDGNGLIIVPKSIEPDFAEILTREGFAEKATVVLSRIDIESARKNYVIKPPFVQLAPGDLRYGDLVKITLPPTELPDRSIQTTGIGFTLSDNLKGRYQIELENEAELKTTTFLKASDEAFDAYKNQATHIFVVAIDGDENREGPIEREVVYHFPIKYVAEGKIKLTRSPRIAKFRLVPLTP